MKNPSLLTLVLLLGIGGTDLSAMGQTTHKPPHTQTQVVAQLRQSLEAEKTSAGKFEVITHATQDEPDVNIRYSVLEAAVRISGPELEKYLVYLLSSDTDSGIRSRAAKELGLLGSQKCLLTLAQAAKNDRPSEKRIGDVGGQSSARRTATFAIADLALRFPALTEKAITILRDLPAVFDPKDNESLADARSQTLYQITHDATLLRPFFERLKSKDTTDRINGVVAFRFLKLKHAPPEIVHTLQDMNTNVRSWTALVLGEIADPQTDTLLMHSAGNNNEDISVRCNAIYSLGHMRASKAGDLMEKLLADPNVSVQGNAAIALYRITGKKAKQFPAGYNAD